MFPTSINMANYERFYDHMKIKVESVGNFLCDIAQLFEPQELPYNRPKKSECEDSSHHKDS